MIRETRNILVLLPGLLLGGCGGGDTSFGAGPAPTPTPTAARLAQVFTGVDFGSPLFFTQPPGDNLHEFVVSQDGVITMVNADGSNPHVFLDMTAQVTDEDGEQGLLGLAFDPNYAANGFFYVNYNPVPAGGGSRQTFISRFHVSADPALADAASETLLLSYAQPFANHKGGWLGFGPEGLLYIGAGDGGGTGDPDNNAQNLGVLLGKILRINRDGSVPADNPFVGTVGARGEIWARGLRNPFRASFDRGTGDLWAGDVGQNAFEEVDLIVRAGNYGWRKFEGNHVFNASDPTPPGAIAPVLEYPQQAGRCGVIGGYVYRGSAITALAGKYLYADFCTGEIFALTRSGATATSALLVTAPGPVTSFGENAAGEIYVTSSNGNVYQLLPPV